MNGTSSPIVSDTNKGIFGLSSGGIAFIVPAQNV